MLLKKIFSCAVLAVSLATFSAAAEQPFQITDSDNLQISWHGKPLVISEKFSGLGQEGFAQSEKRQENIGKHQVFNHFGSINNMAYRREAVLKDGGREVEISFQVNVPAYTEEAINKPQSYAIMFNYKDFANWKYSAITGRIDNPKIVSGTLLPDAADGNLLKTSIRQIALESPDGSRKLVIDCSPGGVNDFYSDYPPNGIMSLWGFQKNKDKMIVYVGYNPKFYGGSNTGKVQLYEGTAQDYDQRHAQKKYPYFTELAPDRQYALAADNFGKEYIGFGLAAYNDFRKAGWLDTAGIQKTCFKPSGAVYSALSSREKKIFRMSKLRSGVHILTLLAPAYDQAVQNMNIAVNGVNKVKNLNLEPYTVTIITLPVWIENGVADIEFSGSWQIATVADQLLQSSAEDFSFRRGFWVSQRGPHPAVMFQSEHYLTEPEFKVGISSYALPIPGNEMQAERKAMVYTTSHAQFADGTDWRNSAIIGGWGPSNNGSFDEFSAPGAIVRRMDEIQSDKIDTVILNGLLSRHTYIHHIDRVEKAVAEITAEAHRRNIKIIDHWDFSELWNCDSGFRLMTERMDQLQHTVSGGLPARGLCLTNPITRQVFFDSVIKHIRATDIDGLMVDESCFHTINFCGCAYCRTQFKQDTNWELPADETSKELFNKNSPLWQAWLSWRMKAVGDFWVALRQAVKDVKPDLVFIGYTTHYGMYSNFASVGMGASLDQIVRAWDFVGTEIMSRNIFASYRSVNCFRLMKNMFRNVYNLPVFGLVYSDSGNWDIMYFGWALNNLHAQTTWDSGAPCPAGKPNYRQFDITAGNMDKSTAESQAKIAMFFNNYGRDIDKSASAHVDIMGFSQVMSANHIPHDFIFEAGLTPEVLNKYKVLFINNATAMREQDILTIRDFVQQGGTVYFSNFAGFYNDIGQKHEVWPIGKHLLQNSDYNRSSQSKFNGLTWQNGKQITLSAPFYYLPHRLSSELETLMTLQNGSKKGFPGLVCSKLGQGKVFYSPVAFGAYAAAFEVSSRGKMNFAVNPQFEAIILDIIKTVAQEHFVWETSNVPAQVITSLYKTGDGKLAAHFLNATKSNYPKGMVLPSLPPADIFAPLMQEMSFKVQYHGSRAYAVSPEFGNPIDLQLKRDGEFATVTIPAGTLKGYMIVYVE
ncbi:MAG: hypothetical protein E7056_09365 [Lentisphaerae bacterium]|nr:hypothetical protein [Lentisphaerota bacterium]